MVFRQLGKVVRLRGVEAFKRRERVVQMLDQLTRSIEFVISKPGPWLGAVQRGRLAALELFELQTEAIKIPREATASGLRPRASQQRQFQRFDRGPERTAPAAELAERMLQERQQGRRLKLPRCRLRGEPGKNSRR